MRILIMGTSHSVGQCRTQDGLNLYNMRKRKKQPLTDEDHRYINEGWLSENDRWYSGLLKNHEVVVLGNPGASPAQQYWALLNYHHQYPDEKFDFGILEGRHPPSASQPYDFDDNQVDTPENRLNLWIGPHPEVYALKSSKIFIPFRNARWDNISYPNWWEDYITSPLSIVDTVSANFAIMAVLELMCSKAKFVPYSKPKAIEEEDLFLVEKFKDIYGIPELWNGFSQPFYGQPTNNFVGACGHFNAAGNKIIQEFVTPILERELK